MSFDDKLAIVAAVVGFLLIFFFNYKIFTSTKKVLEKIFLFVLTIFLFIPLWYLIQFAVTETMALVVPQNKNVHCFQLNERNCKKRSDCDLYLNIGGLGMDFYYCGKK